MTRVLAMPRRLSPMTADLLLGTSCAALVWLLFVRPVDPQDLEVFLRAGRAVVHGVSPYVAPLSPRVWSGHAYVYPYLTAWVFAPSSGLSDSAAALIYYLASVAALFAAARLVAGRSAGPVPVMLVLTAEPVVRGLQLGTVNVWLLLGLALAWRFRDRFLILAASLAAVVIAKLFLLPMLAWLVLTRRYRAALATAGLGTGGLLVGCWLAHQPLDSFARMLESLSAHEGPRSSSLTALLRTLGAGPTVALIVVVLLAGAVVAAGWLGSRRVGNEAVLFGACLVAAVLASPIVWSHYYALLLLIPLTLSFRPATLLTVLAVSWLVGRPDGLPAVQRLIEHTRPFPGAGWCWGAVLAAAALSWRYRDTLRASARLLVTDGLRLATATHTGLAPARLVNCTSGGDMCPPSRTMNLSYRSFGAALQAPAPTDPAATEIRLP